MGPRWLGCSRKRRVAQSGNSQAPDSLAGAPCPASCPSSTWRPHAVKSGTRPAEQKQPTRRRRCESPPCAPNSRRPQDAGVRQSTLSKHSKAARAPQTPIPHAGCEGAATETSITLYRQRHRLTCDSPPVAFGVFLGACVGKSRRLLLHSDVAGAIRDLGG